jgi:hypothetical protein
VPQAESPKTGKGEAGPLQPGPASDNTNSENERTGPCGRGARIQPAIPRQRGADWGRQQWPHNVRAHRRISRDLDVVCGVRRPDARDVHVDEPPADGQSETPYNDVDYWASTGMCLGWPERVAAGRALRREAA